MGKLAHIANRMDGSINSRLERVQEKVAEASTGKLASMLTDELKGISEQLQITERKSLHRFKTMEKRQDELSKQLMALTLQLDMENDDTG